MSMTAAQQQAALDRQVQAWKEELRSESTLIADLIPATIGSANKAPNCLP